MKHSIRLLLLILPVIGLSQNARFIQINVDNGLSQNSVYCITQDEQGFIWMGTDGGLNRYDGKKTVVYRHNPNNKNSVSSNHIIGLVSDKKNNLWIATRDKGINKLDLKTGKFTHYKFSKKNKNGLLTDHILGLNIDKKGNILVGTSENGLNILNPATNQFEYLRYDSLKKENSLVSKSVRCISVDSKGNYWIGHFDGGVSMYNPLTKKITKFTPQSTDPKYRLNNGVVRGIYCDSHDLVWISTWSGGMNIYDLNKQKLYSTNEDIKKAGTDDSRFYSLNALRMVFGLTEDNNGNLWISGAEQGLACYNYEKNKLSVFKNDPNDPNSICENNLFSAYSDRNGMIWAGSFSSGVSVFNPYAYSFGLHITSSEKSNGLRNHQVYSAHVSKHTGNVYIGTLGGVYKMNDATGGFDFVAVDKNGNSLLHEQGIVQCIYEDKEGDLWIAINGAGVFQYTPATKEFINHHPRYGEESLLNVSATEFKEDKLGNMWVAIGYCGVDKYDASTKTFTHFMHDEKNKNSLSSYIVRDIEIDHENNVWVATDSGINVINTVDRSIKSYKNDPANKTSIVSNNIQVIYKDAGNTIWIGTDRGLSYFDSKKNCFINLSTKHHLLDETISGIVEDKQNFLWLVGNKGLIQLNRYNYAYKTYDFNDGLQGNEFSGPSLVCTKKGQIVAGGNKGINCFYPFELRENQIAPTIALTQILLRNKPLKTNFSANFTPSIELNYDHYFFTVEFAALDFVNPNKNKFKYRLIGYNDEWIDLENKSEVTFVNLDPGDYTLEIAASNNNNIWNNEGVHLKIVVHPPFWRTYWFYSCCIAFAVVLIVLYIKARERKLQKEKHELEDAVQERTLELKEEKEKVEEANKEIKDSINYAKRIQFSLLAHHELLEKNLSEFMVMFKPKDIVSGDFYWATKAHHSFYLAVCDCTGHGVPGAFMSLLNISFLNEAINEKGIHEPNEVLNHVRKRLIENIENSKDGMDGTLIRFEKNKITYSSAHNYPVLIRNKEIIELNADKMPVGQGISLNSFEKHALDLQKNDMLFFYTDGYADQFGGPKGKKFKYKNLNQLLLSLAEKPLPYIQQQLESSFKEWKGDLEQVDDVCIIGIRI